MKDNWTDKLPSLMEEYQEVPPEGLWDAVQAGLSRPKIIWWPWVAGVVAAAAAVVLSVFLWRPDPDVIPADIFLAGRLADVPVEELVAPKTVVRVQIAPKTHPEEQIIAPQEQKEPETHLEEPKTDVQVQKEPETHLEEPAPEPERPSVMPTGVPQKKKFHGRITVSSGGNLLAQATSSVSQGYGVSYSPGIPGGNAPAVKSVISPMLLSRNRPSTTEENHRQLLRFSLECNYQFAPRWSAGTGISYTILNSDYTTISGTTETRSTRNMRYLGIPLNLQFRLLEWKRLSMYLSAGPMVEKLIDAKMQTQGYVSGRQSINRKEDLSCQDIRWSLNAGAGLQLQISSGSALFIQPGLSWHLPQNSGVESYYTARPLAFSLDVGIRWFLY